MPVARKKKHEISSGVNTFYLFILGIAFSYPLFRQGLWFDYQWLPYQLAVAVCAVAFFIYKKPSMVSLEAIDLAAIAFVTIYGFTILVAVDTHGAIQEALMVAAYVLLFALVAQSLSSIGEVEILLKIFYWAGIAVVLVSLGAAFGIYNWQGVLQSGRIYSILQYPNIFACYALVVLLIGLYFGEKPNKPLWQAVYSFANYAALVGFFGAGSRAALLAMLPVFLIYIAGLGPNIIRVTLKMFIYLAASYLYINRFFNPALSHGPGYYFLMFSLLSLPCLLAMFINKLNENKKVIKTARVVIVVATLVVLVGIAIGVKMNLFNNRMLDFTSANGTYAERLVFYQDAVNIAMEHFILGTGGKGWESLYRLNQGYGYMTSTVHNHYLQVWVEAGTLGLLAYLGVWLSAILVAIKMLRSGQQENRFLILTILCAFLLFGIHSFGDFDLSMPAMMIILWGLFGCLRALQKIQGSPRLFNNKWQLFPNRKPIIVVVIGIFLVLSVLQVTALNIGDQGLADLQGRSYASAKENLELAVKINPFASIYLASLAEDLMFIGDANSDDKVLKEASMYINRAIKLDSNHPNYRLVKGKILLLLDNIEPAVGEFEQAAKFAPWDQKYADRLAETYFAVGQYYYLKQDKAKAREYLDKAVQYPGLISRRVENMSPKYKQLQLRLPGLTVSEKIQMVSQKAEQLKMKV